MKRALFVIESLFDLGSARQLYPLAKEMVASDYEVHIGVVEVAPAELTRWEALGISVHLIGTGGFSSPFSRASFHAVLKLRKLIRQIRPDVVHGWCGMSQWLTLAGTEIGCPSSMRRYMTELSLQPEKLMFRQMYENRSSSGFDKFFVPHDVVKQQMIDHGCDRKRFEIVPNRALVPELDRVEARKAILAQLGLPDHARVAGAVAPLVPKTRLKDLIWAIDLLVCVRDDIHLVIFGSGHQQRRLQKFASQTEAQTHVHFLGTPANARQLIGGLDFFWQSHLQEPLPGNLMLCMALEIPVISVFGPGTSELVRHQETGFVVNLGARDEYARWTKYLIEMPEAAAKLAAQGKEYVVRKFDDRKLLQPYRSAYELTP